jgi:hypothetical protein
MHRMVEFIPLLIILIWVLPDDPEWVEFCAVYYPELSISSCRSVSGGLRTLTSSMHDLYAIIALSNKASANVVRKLPTYQLST